MAARTRKEKIWAAEERTPWFSGLGVSEALLVALAGAALFSLAAVMRPFRPLRIGLLHHRAMGRFYGATEYYLRLRKFYPEMARDHVVLVSGAPVNTQILTMVARKVPVVRSDSLWRIFDLLRRRTGDHPIWIDLGCTGWLRGAEWISPGPQLAFTSDEHRRGQALLRQLGIPEGARHVCMFAKDRRYSDSPDRPPDPASYWGTRDFRNCDIANYLTAADYLASQGIWVLRMGIHQPEALLPPGRRSQIIDYTGVVRPTSTDPDFADAYLQATCKFFLGATSGIYLLSSMFGVPVAYANMIPYQECGRMPHDIVIFKKCRDRRTGQVIPLAKLIGMGLDADWLTVEEIDRLEAQGVEFVENSDDEILALAREMNERLDGTWRAEAADEALQRRFRQISPARCFDGSDFPGRVGAEFLRRNQALLEA